MSTRFYAESTSFTYILHKFAFVGSIFQHALQAKEFTFFGMFKLQIFLQIFLCVSSFEGSPTPLFMASSKASDDPPQKMKKI